MANIIQDNKGNTSSKRVCGLVLGAAGITFACITFFMSLYHPLGDAKTCLEITGMTLGACASLLGLGALFERIGKGS